MSIKSSINSIAQLSQSFDMIQLAAANYCDDLHECEFYNDENLKYAEAYAHTHAYLHGNDDMRMSFDCDAEAEVHAINMCELHYIFCTEGNFDDEWETTREIATQARIDSLDKYIADMRARSIDYINKCMKIRYER